MVQPDGQGSGGTRGAQYVCRKKLDFALSLSDISTMHLCCNSMDGGERNNPAQKTLGWDLQGLSPLVLVVVWAQ